jgi:ribonuclease HI
MIVIYTDGSCKPTNPGPCSSGVALVIDGEVVECRSMFLGEGTNNVGELTAISIALDVLESRNLSWKSSTIITDSKYAIGVLTGGWKAKKNVELIKNIKAKLENFPNTELQWIKGHSGDKFNDLVDALAGQIIDSNV